MGLSEIGKPGIFEAKSEVKRVPISSYNTRCIDLRSNSQEKAKNLKPQNSKNKTLREDQQPTLKALSSLTTDRERRDPILISETGASEIGLTEDAQNLCNLPIILSITVP